VNRTHTVLAICLLSATMVAWLLTSRDHQPGAPSRVPASTVNDLDVQANLATQSSSGQRDTELPETDHLERILGIDVRKDRPCTVEIRYVVDSESSTSTEAYVCIPDETEEQDPYESWDASTLAALAYGDAHAAAVLGLRHVVSENRMEEVLGLALLYRSVALSGDLDTFKKAIGLRYSVVEIDAEPNLHNLKQLAVFATIASRLGDDSLHPDRYFERLRQHVPDEEITTILTGVDAVLETMAAIQTGATGDTTIREALENA